MAEMVVVKIREVREISKLLKYLIFMVVTSRKPSIKSSHSELMMNTATVQIL